MAEVRDASFLDIVGVDVVVDGSEAGLPLFALWVECERIFWLELEVDGGFSEARG